VDAVNCALAIQHAVKELEPDAQNRQCIRYRIGLHIGDVIVEGDDLLGDGVNVASRLEGLAEPGGLCISEDVYRQVESKVDIEFDYAGERSVKNRNKPLKIYRQLDSKDARNPNKHLVSTAYTLNQSSKPSIIVLPFEQIGGQVNNDYFADGVTEDIITELSRFHELNVIARNSTFAYKAQNATASQLQEELDVHYMLHGSIQTAGSRLRLNVRLVDTKSGVQIWTERYDRELLDIFELQDDLTGAIIAVLPTKIRIAEMERVRRLPAENMAAYECLCAGKIHHHKITRKDNQIALQFLTRAADLDPDLAEAHAWRACTLGQALQFGFCDDFAITERDALNSVQSALALDEHNVECHRLLCEVYMERKMFDEAVRHGDRAINGNPNDPRILAQQGELNTWIGNPQQGIEWLEKAFLLDPHGALSRLHLMGRALYGCNRYADAVAAYNKILSPTANQVADLAAACAQAGMDGAAKLHAQEVLQKNPEFSISKYSNALCYRDSEDLEHHLKGLTKSALPK
jgi:adenylate cyclase